MNELPTELLLAVKEELKKPAPSALESIMRAWHTGILFIIDLELAQREKEKTNGTV